ncbi:MAG: hypothetical protein QXD11_02265 [Candidatus Micrarchaeaceae archaeon]
MEKNVGKFVVNVIKELNVPKDDEIIAADLNIRSNIIRSILNRLQGYGITNYYISKNINGWLSFSWYINVNKIPAFFDYIAVKNTEKVINDYCNDYFICENCYKKDKLIFTFDKAMESEFKCRVCNEPFKRLSKAEVLDIMEKEKKKTDEKLNELKIRTHP